MILRDDASESQVRAANPIATTWVAANAGSGKTRVLTDRVARLLLRGVQPQHILCLTYTKAAATEMQNRLFKRLGDWAMKPDDRLRRELDLLGEGGALGRDDLAKARRLFARALETPGGLRIQTIHSFCATLLRRFPLEAGVSPGFAELDDRAARLLRAKIVEEMAETRAPEVMADVASIYTGDDFTALMEQVANARHGFGQPLSKDEAFRRFGLDPCDSETRLIAETFQGNETALFAELLPLLAASGPSDQKARENLAEVNLTAPGLADLAVLERVFLHSDSVKEESKRLTAKIDAFPTKDLRGAFAHRMDQLNGLMLRIEAARARRLGLEAARKTLTLHRFAHAFLPLYAEAKARHGWLDFDDLIHHAKSLLTDSTVAAWVLYRLDGGIDHILVDEAQDTSPDQWRVIELLAAEFTAGQGAQDEKVRTLFVVGDKKQSIYSFQGADVAAFDEKHRLFHHKFTDARLQFQTVPLEYSFRSAPAILQLVDATFDKGFEVALGEGFQHIAFKTQLPGRVDLWPLIETTKTEEDGAWEDPVDLVSETHHTAQLANAVAAEIARMIREGTRIIDEDGRERAVHAGDFLILVQRRSALFSEMIRACKKERLPIAGADRLKLGGELAVKDLAALLSFLATPEDDLSLAAVLRSPLCGWTEDELYRLARGRPGFLWEALRNHDGQPETLAMLRDLLDQSDFLRPFDLLERALTRHQGRQRLIARLGEEAEDGIDELLSQALAYEQNDVPSLTGFLIWLETDEVTVKRQMEGAGEKIRVMTVHGAKGLEAPIVILPDTTDRKPRDRDEIYRLDDGLPVWKTASDASPKLIATARARRKADQDAESARLLYVALTRPRSWLIVAGAGDAKTDTNAGPKPVSEWSWYRLVERGMTALGAQPIEGGRLRFSTGLWPDAGQPHQNRDGLRPVLPDWTTRPLNPPPETAPVLSPSDLGGAKALGADALGEGEEAAKARGTALHLLLEHLPSLPSPGWSASAEALVPNEALRQETLSEAVRLMEDQALGWIFGPDGFSEVPVTAKIGTTAIMGTIDRLFVAPDRIRVVDFKSNSVVPARPEDVPEGILRQMGAYAAALAQVYPNRPVETLILWTRTGLLMPLPPDIVSAALARAAIP